LNGRERESIESKRNKKEKAFKGRESVERKRKRGKREN
jgi:hypothetical protein